MEPKLNRETKEVRRGVMDEDMVHFSVHQNHLEDLLRHRLISFVKQEEEF